MQRGMQRRGQVFLECLASIGDSMTWRPSIANSYPSLIGASRGFDVIQNAGVDGEAAATLAARFDRDVLSWRPGAISIMTGTNDASALTNVVTFETAVRAMVNKGIASGARVTLCTPPICRADARPLETYNDILRDIAGDTSGVILFDVYEVFDALDSGTLDTYYEADDTHLNLTGNQAIRDMALEAENLTAFTIKI